MNRPAYHLVGMRRWLVATLVLLPGIVILCTWGCVPPEVEPGQCQLERNAFWASVDWTSQPHDPTAVAALAQTAATGHVRYVLPYTTYLKADGSFSPSDAHAAAFVAAFRRSDANAALLAWIGVPLTRRHNLGVPGYVNLADAATRTRIAAFAAHLVQEDGFDGVHLDVETVWDGDPDFLRLLEGVRAAVGPTPMLSVAGAHWSPPLLSRVPGIGGLRWSSGYYRAVAARGDQIAAMSYDSYLPVPVLYRLWLRQQTRGLSEVLKGSKAELLMGLSVSREATASHRPSAENMRSGLAGICAGLKAAGKSGHTVQGIAVYASWEADTRDWADWARWQGTTPGTGIP